MGRRNILLCFDAFGTLFQPKRPVAEQYAAVASQCGLGGFSAEQVQASFKTAFSEASEEHPNYGRASGMGAEKWWANVSIRPDTIPSPALTDVVSPCQVIHKTFQPLAGPGRELPKDLAPRLLHRFSSKEGYNLCATAGSLLHTLKQRQQQQQGQNHHPQVIVGVITNSDDRVPNILSSIGLRVSPLRFGSSVDLAQVATQLYDIDLHCMSYDVGSSKPDRKIFDAAEDMANQLLAAQVPHESRSPGLDQAPPTPWLKIYVGDEYEKDVVGARRAGWNPVFVGAETDVPGQENVLDWKQLGDMAVEEIYPEGSDPMTVRAENTQEFLEWALKNLARGK